MAKTRQAALIWSQEDQQYLWRDEHYTDTIYLREEPEAWLKRLAAYTSFSFQGREGHLTLLKEARPRGGDGYWYAYRRQGKRWIAARENDDVITAGKMGEEKGHGLVNARGGDSLVIVQHQKPSPLTLRQRVQKHREGWLCQRRFKGRLRHAPQESQGFLSHMVAKNMAGGHEIAPEAHRIVIASIQRNPGNRRKMLLFATFSHPLAHQRGFSKARWRGYQR